VNELRAMVQEDLDRACLMSLTRTIDYVTGQGHFLDPDTITARDDFLTKEKING